MAETQANKLANLYNRRKRLENLVKAEGGFDVVSANPLLMFDELYRLQRSPKYKEKLLSKAKKQLAGLKRNSKVSKVTIPTYTDEFTYNEVGQINIYTKGLHLHAPNGRTAYLGKFLIRLCKTFNPIYLDESWQIFAENLDNGMEFRDHPHIVDDDFCMGARAEETIINQLNKQNVYIAVDRIIHLLETFNHHDECAVYTRFWFEKDNIHGGYEWSMQEMRKELCE